MKDWRLVLCAFGVTASLSPLAARGVTTDSSEEWAAAPRVTRVPVGDRGTLTFSAPSGWEYKLKQQPGLSKPVVHLRFRARDHYVQMTAMLTGFEGKDAKAWARGVAQEAGTEHLPGAVETALAVETLSGVQAYAAYYTLTDKSLAAVSAPPPGQYRVMTEGALAVGDVAIAFTILGNDKDSPLRKDILQMFSTATYKLAP